MAKKSSPKNSGNKELRFDVNATVVRQLGEELVSDEVTALLELAKNAWDADADWIEIDIDSEGVLEKTSGSDFAGAKGFIMIEDNGVGMSYEDIERGWLTISMSTKREMKKGGQTTKKGRTPLGEKGLGRLSTQRLGKNLDLITHKKQQPAHHISFSWDDFRDGMVLSEVHINHTNPEDCSIGTKLIISGLKDQSAWDGKARQQLESKLSQLISPFETDSVFSVKLKINGEKINLSGVMDRIREAATSIFEIEFDGKKLVLSGRMRQTILRGVLPNKHDSYDAHIVPDAGKSFYDYLCGDSKKIPKAKYLGNDGWLLSFNETIDIKDLNLASTIISNKKTMANPGPFKGVIYDFSIGLDAADVQQQDSVFDNAADFKKYIKRNAGIRVFRNGFGVRPYGLDGNDWLKLSEGQTSGGSFYGMRPKNVIGYINIDEHLNSYLKDKTDREGFISNSYSANFFTILDNAVMRINNTRTIIRRNYNSFDEKYSKDTSEFVSVEETLDSAKRVSDAGKDLRARSNMAQARIAKVSKNVADIETQGRDTPLLAEKNDGALSSILTEANHALLESSEILNQLNPLLQEAEKISKDVKYLGSHIKVLSTQIQEFAELAALGLTAEALSHEIQTIISRLDKQTLVVEKAAHKLGVTEDWLTDYLDHVRSTVSALRKQISFLAPTLKYVREKKAVFSVNEFCDKIVEYYKPTLNNGGINIDLNLSGIDFNVEMNRGRLTQVFDIIILNSQYWLQKVMDKATNKPAHIYIQIDRPYIQIWDDGPGVSNDIADSIFEPFVSSKPKGEGRGLGLFIAQQLLDPLGGGISLLPKKNKENRKYIFQLDLAGGLHNGKG